MGLKGQSPKLVVDNEARNQPGSGRDNLSTEAHVVLEITLNELSIQQLQIQFDTYYNTGADYYSLCLCTIWIQSSIVPSIQFHPQQQQYHTRFMWRGTPT